MIHNISRTSMRDQCKRHLGEGLVGRNADAAGELRLLPHAPPNGLRHLSACIALDNASIESR